jgi:hypothetical protein
MKRDNQGLAELFYGFFSLAKLRQPEGDSLADAWAAHVLPHSPISELALELWHVTGVLGPTPREMVIYRLPDGGLLIHSAIALDDAGMAQLESLGTPKIMIVPNRIHRIDASIYKRRYPEVVVVAPAIARPYVEEVVAVDAIAEERLPDYGIICHTPAGIRPQELVYELPLAMGKALLFTDILFNLTDAYLEAYAPRSKWLLRWLGAGNRLGITALGKRFFMTDRAAYRQWLQALADSVSSLQVILVAHGEPLIKDCSEQLRAAANRLA